MNTNYSSSYQGDRARAAAYAGLNAGSIRRTTGETPRYGQGFNYDRIQRERGW